MTHTESGEELEAGRALDALVAEKVMGWRLHTDWFEVEGAESRGETVGFVDHEGLWLCRPKEELEVWSPSVSIAAAFQMMEPFGTTDAERHEGWAWELLYGCEDEDDSREWGVTIGHSEHGYIGPNGLQTAEHRFKGDSAAHALSLAALAAAPTRAALAATASIPSPLVEG